MVGANDDDAAFGLDRWMIHLRLYNRRRFALATVLVIDYELPGRSGLALCRELAAHPAKRLMLTGRGGPELAVQALNDGLIDAYVEKSHPDLAREVAHCVRGLQARPFAELVTPVVELLKQGRQRWCLNETLWALLRQHLQDCRAVEHYLIGDPPGFLIVDAAGGRTSDQLAAAISPYDCVSGDDPDTQAVLDQPDGLCQSYADAMMAVFVASRSVRPIPSFLLPALRLRAASHCRIMMNTSDRATQAERAEDASP